MFESSLNPPFNFLEISESFEVFKIGLVRCEPGSLHSLRGEPRKISRKRHFGWEFNNEVFSPDAFVEGEDDQGCGGDRGDGSGIEGDVLEGLEVLDQGVGPLGGSPH